MPKTPTHTASSKYHKQHSAPQLWGGRFSKPVDKKMWDYSKSIEVDYVLAEFDICGSIAHVHMLIHGGILNKKEGKTILRGLRALYKKWMQGQLVIDNNSEDIHSYIEHTLQQNIGDIALSMHLGRSRNDQVAVDLHLYTRSKICSIIGVLHNFVSTLLEKARTHTHTIFPGYTHLQRAEPIWFSHHLLAYVNMGIRDMQRLQDIWKRVNISPLGAGAFSGSPLAIDNEFTARFLQFDGVYDNSMDAVSDRDFVVELLAALSLIQMHISKFSEELILWASSEFNFIELDDAFCTGSSMMPQKKNPDLAELARGKTGEMYGALISVLTTLKGLPLSYNRDLQEDKKPLFLALESIESTIPLFTAMIESMQVRQEDVRKAVYQDYSNATEIANYLCEKKQLVFRAAHEISGKIVQYAIEKGVMLETLTIEEFHHFSPLFEEDVLYYIDRERIINKHTARGGTATSAVKKQLSTQSKRIKSIHAWLTSTLARIDTTDIIRQ